MANQIHSQPAWGLVTSPVRLIRCRLDVSDNICFSLRSSVSQPSSTRRTWHVSKLLPHDASQICFLLHFQQVHLVLDLMGS